jgi:hypothetical protein
VVKTKVDFAWLTSAAAQRAVVGFTVPASGISKLSLANPSSSVVDLRVVQGGSATSAFKIPAAGQLTLKFAPGSKLQLFGNDKSFYATMIVDVNGAVASLQLLDYKNPGGQVSVMVR